MLVVQLESAEAATDDTLVLAQDGSDGSGHGPRFALEGVLQAC